MNPQGTEVQSSFACLIFACVGGSGRVRRPSTTLVLAQVLRQWLLSPEHFDFPYPDAAERTILSRERCVWSERGAPRTLSAASSRQLMCARWCSRGSGLDDGKLSNWFTNARKRIWRPMRLTAGLPVPDFSSWQTRMEFESSRKAVRLARARQSVRRQAELAAADAGGVPLDWFPGDEVFGALGAPAPAPGAPSATGADAGAAVVEPASSRADADSYMQGRNDVLRELWAIIGGSSTMSHEALVAAISGLASRRPSW